MYDLKDLLQRSIEENASDVHFTVGKPPCYRIDGVLTAIEGERLMPDTLEELLFPIMEERHREELKHDGQTDFAYAIAGVGRFRLNVFRQRGTLSSVMRCLPFEIPEPQSLGIPKEVVEVTNRKRGLVLVTGPTGSGKSTTLASLLHVINQSYPYHIITLEDPIEYLHRHNQSVVTQREIGLDTESYVTGLRAALRQAPDVILVGEMRDEETIKTALTAAETGHLVISTLHTIGAANTIDRIIDSFPPAQQEQVRAQLSMVMQAVVSQQLIPKVEGGVVPAFEVMFFNNAIRNLIRESKIHQIDNIIATSQEEGMITMDNSIIKLFREGKISKENAIIYSSNGELMEKKLARL